MAASKNANLLPEDSADAPVDVQDIRVDFSSEEASSEGRSFDPIPTGKYHVAVTDNKIELCGPKSKNPGKPMWNMELTIQSGEYENRKLWVRVMLFNGALYTLAQFEKAFRGIAITAGEYKVPAPNEVVGLEAVAIVKKQVDKYAIDNGEWNSTDGSPKPMKNEVKGFNALDSLKAADSGSSSLMP